MLKKVDKVFLLSIVILAIAGFFIFTSASLGILAQNEAKFTAVALNQLLFGLVGGFIGLFITASIPYKYWKKYSLYLFLASLAVTVLVFTPLGVRHGGALRWVDLGFISFQPSEALKIGYILYLAALFSKFKDKISTFKFGLLPFLALTGIVALPILAQPDNDTFLMIAVAGLAVYAVAGARWRDIGIILLIGLIGATAVVFTRPYVLNRITTFLDASKDPLGGGYQIQQSLIAIGSGGIMGKGFGQSTQKYGFLPEPIGDSIFAVAGEEFGFIGSVSIIFLFLFFSLRALKIASNASDPFGRLLVTGIVILITTGSFINIAAMLGIIPLSGTPLMFISHGGTALFLALCQVGIILNVSKGKSK